MKDIEQIVDKALAIYREKRILYEYELIDLCEEYNVDILKLDMIYSQLVYT